MAGRKDFVLRGAGIVAVAGVLAGGGTYVIGGGEPEPGLANIWIEDGAGACAAGRSATPIAYADSASPDRRCGSLDQAWDAMNAGDTARMLAGDYDPQWITGDKASTTKIIGASKTSTFIGNATTLICNGSADDTSICVDGANLWLEEVTLYPGPDLTTASAAHIRQGENTTFRNVNTKGRFPSVYVEAPGFMWWGGSMGEDGTTTTPPLCGGAGEGAGLPVGIQSGADDAVIDGIRFNPITIADPPCEPHVETIRLEGASDGVIIRNNWFMGGSDVGSGHIFTGGPGGSTNVRIVNNWFEAVDGTYWCQCGTAGSGWVIAYNTFTQANTVGSAAVWVGNLGFQQGCSTNIKNVWIGSGSCGTDTYTGGTLGELGIDADGNLQAGSPAIDAAETPGASDYCTDPAYVNSVDRHGGIRPVGSVCDAGSDERP